MDGYGSVSYTHLDVYKRQVCVCEAPVSNVSRDDEWCMRREIINVESFIEIKAFSNGYVTFIMCECL